LLQAVSRFALASASALSAHSFCFASLHSQFVPVPPQEPCKLRFEKITPTSLARETMKKMAAVAMKAAWLGSSVGPRW
jgi:hypothetical protein